MQKFDFFSDLQVSKSDWLPTGCIRETGLNEGLTGYGFCQFTGPTLVDLSYVLEKCFDF